MLLRELIEELWDARERLAWETGKSTPGARAVAEAEDRLVRAKDALDEWERERHGGLCE